jgi:hypothetical protein
MKTLAFTFLILLPLLSYSQDVENLDRETYVATSTYSRSVGSWSELEKLGIRKSSEIAAEAKCYEAGALDCKVRSSFITKCKNAISLAEKRRLIMLGIYTERRESCQAKAVAVENIDL